LILVFAQGLEQKSDILPCSEGHVGLAGSVVFDGGTFFLLLLLGEQKKKR